MVGKDSTAPYVEGRTRYWLKVKVHQEEEFVIGGFTPPGGTRAYFGALLLGAYRGTDLVYVGKVGTGFTQKTLAELYRKLAPLARKAPPFVNPPREKGAIWVAPKRVQTGVSIGRRLDSRRVIRLEQSHGHFLV